MALVGRRGGIGARCVLFDRIIKRQGWTKKEAAKKHLMILEGIRIWRLNLMMPGLMMNE